MTEQTSERPRLKPFGETDEAEPETVRVIPGATLASIYDGLGGFCLLGGLILATWAILIIGRGAQLTEPTVWALGLGAVACIMTGLGAMVTAVVVTLLREIVIELRKANIRESSAR